MANNATTFKISNGTVLSVSLDGGTTFVPVKQLKTVTFTGSDQDFEDITNLDSPGAYKEYAPTNLTAGDVALDGIWSPKDPGQIGLSAAFEAQMLLPFKLQFPAGAGETSGPLLTWSAYVKGKPSFNAAVGKTVPYSTSLRITGPRTDNPGQ